MSNGKGITQSLFRKKSAEEAIATTEEPERHLRRSLNAWDLAIMAIAVAVGAGIFSVGAEAAAKFSGPAVVISFIIAAIVCGLAAVCYAEFASAMPVSGSAYTFSYVSMGELIAWIIGWDLILEMFLAGSVIAKYWGIYLDNAMTLFFGSPENPISASFYIGGVHVAYGPVIVVLVFSALLAVGTRLSARVNAVFTVIKVGIVIFVIIAGLKYIDAANYTPFVPPAEPAPATSSGWTQSLMSWITGSDPSVYGVFGLLSGAALVFFAFIGFDVVATSAEEAKDPQRTVPKGMLGGLGIVTVLYVLVSLVVTGMVSYKVMAALPADQPPSLTTAFQLVGADWAGKIIAVGALVGLTSVVMVLLYGVTRVIFAMSRDGLLPRGISKTNERFGTPLRIHVGIGIIIAICAALLEVGVLAEMINIGTLSAFILVSFGVPILRKNRPDLKRGFRVPWSPVLPIISGLACIWLSMQLSLETWMRFIVWLAVGMIIYFGYSRRNAVLAKKGPDAVTFEEGPIMITEED